MDHHQLAAEDNVRQIENEDKSERMDLWHLNYLTLIDDYKNIMQVVSTITSSEE